MTYSVDTQPHLWYTLRSKMFTNIVAALAAFSLFGHTIISPISSLRETSSLIPGLANPKVSLAQHQFSLEKRYDNAFVNSVFKDNILLNVAYLSGKITSPDQINWNNIEKPFEYKFTLEPGRTFAYHNDVLAKYEGKVTQTTNAHFNSSEGFKSDGYLVGDGVCHLASLIYWTAKDAGLEAVAPTNHDFMPINEIPKQYGVAIYDVPGQKDASANQNLYITNNKNKPVEFKFAYAGDTLKVSVSELD